MIEIYRICNDCKKRKRCNLKPKELGGIISCRWYKKNDSSTL